LAEGWQVYRQFGVPGGDEMRTKEMGWQSWQLVAKEWKTSEELHGKWGQSLGER